MLSGIFVVLFFFALGELVGWLVGGFIPGSVIGMILLFTALCLKIVKPDRIKPVAKFLCDNMALFFVPAGVGIVNALDILSHYWQAVLVACAGAAGETMTVASTFALALGIAIQNFPEGAVISMPLKGEGVKKGRAFAMGVLSGVVEPIGAVAMILLASFIAPLLPYMLSFAAGAMMYVVIEELIPEAQGGEHSNIGTIGAAAGFVVMMVLDCTLG